jgi:hypothetical protein
MELQVGDRFSDESGEWEIVGRPYSTVGGKKTEVRVQRVDKPGVTEIRTWGSYEKITLRRRRAAGRASDAASALKTSHRL